MIAQSRLIETLTTLFPQDRKLRDRNRDRVRLNVVDNDKVDISIPKAGLKGDDNNRVVVLVLHLNRNKDDSRSSKLMGQSAAQKSSNFDIQTKVEDDLKDEVNKIKKIVFDDDLEVKKISDEVTSAKSARLRSNGDIKGAPTPAKLTSSRLRDIDAFSEADIQARERRHLDHLNQMRLENYQR